MESTLEDAQQTSGTHQTEEEDEEEMYHRQRQHLDRKRAQQQQYDLEPSSASYKADEFFLDGGGDDDQEEEEEEDTLYTYRQHGQYALGSHGVSEEDETAAEEEAEDIVLDSSHARLGASLAAPVSLHHQDDHLLA